MYVLGNYADVWNKEGKELFGGSPFFVIWRGEGVFTYQEEYPTPEFDQQVFYIDPPHKMSNFVWEIPKQGEAFGGRSLGVTSDRLQKHD